MNSRLRTAVCAAALLALGTAPLLAQKHKKAAEPKIGYAELSDQ